MTETQAARPPAPRLVGLVAEFDSPQALVAAAAATREEGYRRLEGFSPFPVHGLDGALGLRPTLLPWLVLGAGVGGAAAALAGQWWTNAVDYPFLISGKPLFSLPANIPVMFEVIILASAVTAFLGVLALNLLPRLSNPLFAARRFVRATTDRFFLLVGADDEKFTEAKTRAWLESVGATGVEACYEPAAGQRMPRVVYAAALVVAALALLPPLFILKARATTSSAPRLYVFGEMFFQPKFKPQRPTTLFADGRAMRAPVAGTVAWGELQADERLYRGLEPGSPEPSTAPPAAPGKEAPPEPNWTQAFPLPVTPELAQRGRQKFNIYCAVCHGRAGYGDGLVSQRAQRLQQGTWLPPTSLHTDPVRQQPVGKLFDTITHGIRKMPGYGEQIAVPDRWAIVLYVKALQRSQDATIDDVPADVQKTMREMN